MLTFVTMTAMFSLLLLAVLPLASADDALAATFLSGTRPVDVDGNDVHAHGGCIIKINDTYFWYGTTIKLRSGGWISEGISLYTSTDMQQWKLEGEVIHGAQMQDMPVPPPYRIERPKVIYNDKYEYYVMMWHLDTPSFAYPAVGVAVSPDPRGPFEYKHVFKPDGRNSYDMTLYKSRAGDAYLIRSVENRFLGVSKLTDDYLNTTGLCAIAPRAEAPAAFEADGAAYILSSHLTGWSPNPPMLFKIAGPSLCGTYTVLSSPAVGPGASIDFDSQATYILPYTFDDGRQLMIYMGDRWNPWGPGSVANATYVWLPLVPRPGAQGFYMRWYDKWTIKDFSWAAVGQQPHDTLQEIEFNFNLHPVVQHVAQLRQRVQRAWDTAWMALWN